MKGVAIVGMSPLDPSPPFLAQGRDMCVSAFEQVSWCPLDRAAFNAQLSQDIALGTLNLNTGKIALRLDLPELPAKAGEVSKTPTSSLFHDLLLFSLCLGIEMGAQLDLV